MKKKNGKMVVNCVPKEEIEEINVPTIVKSVISRTMTHPKGYAKMLQDYIQRVKDDIKKKHSNRFHEELTRCNYVWIKFSIPTY